MKTDRGNTLLDLSQEKPVLVIFLRHFGCVFCREAIHDISTIKDELIAKGVRAVFVHMGPHDMALKFFKKYKLDNVEHIEDPDREYYKGFGLLKGKTSQLANFRTFLRGFKAGVVNGHGGGAVIGDGFQMPGVFILYKGKIIHQFIHETISDKPDYLLLVDEALEKC